MARSSGFAEMVSMLHNAVLHGDQSLREALTESVEKIDESGRDAQEATSRAVTEGLTQVFDELNLLRKDVNRAVKPASGDLFASKTEEVTGLLRVELTELRTTLNHLNALALAPLAPAGPGVPSSSQADSQGAHLPQAIPVQRGPGHEDPAVVSPSVPAPTSGPGADDGREPGAQEPDGGTAGEEPAAETTPEATAPALSEETVRQAVREVLAQELTPLVEQLTTPAATAEERPDGAEQLRQAVLKVAGQVRDELATVMEATRNGFASLAQEIAGLRRAVDELQAHPTETPEPVLPNEKHTALLRTAARISSADLRCHRDTWEFLTARTAGHPHFRVPPRVTDEADERVFAPLSGRSLIALLISLHTVTSSTPDGSGDHELAATLYDRIEQRLTRLGPGDGERVTIALDDRVTPEPDDDGDDQDGETGGTGAPSSWGA
ncbi:hypothetical protein [Streptomyces roseolus]|uniref:hypothetical protein n=1 Tax=Streptomyces roseolus TaxID=67358 RepID=UPI0016777BC6|nr:hypothetical protein [Streptomyces roseolus]GGR64072.1 hypothetical protein GCM10010282_66300 [Streptomyces roseolus]